MIDYTGKTVLVTGAASGIGLALAHAFVARGARVVAVDVNADALEGVAQQLGNGSTTRVVDLGDPEAAEQLVRAVWAEIGPVDVLCSNAGVGRNKRLINEQPRADVIKRLFQVNLFAALQIAQAYVRCLEGAGRRGRLMITGSENSLSVPSAVKGAGLGLYAATKHGVLIMAEWMRDEFAARPIDMHILLPGAVYTGLTAGAIPDPANAPPELGLLMPERCAEIALDGMDKGLFYIPTHAHLIDDMGARYEAMRAATAALGLKT
jgi:NAD(P)-dependent dehydrogenase (short-subunit alcohol dehydrogenase family)